MERILIMSLAKLVELQGKLNIADSLDDKELDKIGEQVYNEHMIDKQSMGPWLAKTKEATELAMLMTGPKSFPFENCANIKYPLVASGAITFAAREYSQIVRGNKVVEAAVFGSDPDETKANRAKRVADYMNWQLLVESDKWELDTDKLLIMLATIGTVFRKTYYNPILRKPISELCIPTNITINNNVSDLESQRRIGHTMFLYSNDLVERMRSGVYKEYDLKLLEANRNTSPTDTLSTDDSDRPHGLLEQHRYLDLDNDGYKEPYIVTIHLDSHKVLRIVARFGLDAIEHDDKDRVTLIKPDTYFTDYHYLPSPDGGFLSMGLGTLLAPLNSAINSSINQLLDAATLSNAQPILANGNARMKTDEIKIELGKINKIEGLLSDDIRAAIMALPLIPPSPVMFNLLELMIESGKDLASINDILQGKQPTQNSPATTVVSLIKQGLVQYGATHKRVLRSLKKEFDKIAKLNSQFLDIEQYLRMVDDQMATPDDFIVKDLDIRTVADPNLSSDAQRIAKAEAVLQVLTPNNPVAVRNYLVALDIEPAQIEQLAPMPDPNAPPPPEVQEIMSKVQLNTARAESTQAQIRAKAAELELSANDQKIKEKELGLKAKDCDASYKVSAATVASLLAKAKKDEADAKRGPSEAKST
jgi:chaperonin GroES